MKIAIAQIKSPPGSIAANTKKIIDWIDRAKGEGADIVVFPELSIPGYMALDLFLDDDYIEENIAALKTITKSCTGISAVVGFVDVDRSKIRPDKKLIRYNSSALIKGGGIVTLRDKSLLPEYDIFMEKRYFAASRNRGVIDFEGKRLGLQICEDIYSWGYPINITDEYIEQGMNLLINISASPFSIGKRNVRLDWISRALKGAKVPVVYANLVGSYDGYEGEVIFDGRSMIVNQEGSVLAQGQAFEEDLIVGDFNNDKVVVHYEQNDIKDTYEALKCGIKDYSDRCGFKSACLGISGGIDSAVVAALAVDVFGPENVTLVSMPSEFSSEETRVDAKLIAKNIKSKFLEIPIQSIFECFRSELGPKLYNIPTLSEDFTYENIQSRIRGSLLMALANRSGALLLNTGNKTELALGYCTLYGDMNGGLSPLGDVNKLRVYELANYINRRSSIIPQTIIDRPPTAELKHGQSDEQGLGAPYEILSPLVDHLVESHASISDLKKKFSADLVQRISKRIVNSEFKRRQAPPAIRITDRAFGVGRRLPICY